MNSFSQELEELYNNAPCGYHSLDSEGKFVRVNHSELRMLGYSREEVLGRKFSELLTSESRITFEQHDSLLRQRGSINDLELKLIRKERTILPVSLSATAIKDEAGNFLMSRAVIIEIAKRRRVEPNRRDSETSFHQLAANLPGMLYQYVLHPDGSDAFTYVSSKCREIYELEPQELLQDIKQVWDTIHPDDVERVRQVNLRSARQLERFDIEFRLLPASGCVKWVRAISQPIRQANGDTVWDGVVLDISDRKRLERERLRFLAISCDLEVITGNSGYFHWVSPTCELILGWTPEEMTSRPWSEFVHPDDINSSIAEAASLFSGKDTLAFENRYRHKDGSYRWLLWKAQPYPKEGVIYGAAVDISDRKQAEIERQQQIASQQQIAREHLLAEMTQAIYQTLDVEQILQIAVERIRQFLHIDRVIVFRFAPDWSGKIVAESVTSEANPLLESEICDPCLGETYIEPYRQGRVSATVDFIKSDLEPCYKELMAQFQVRANLVVPILQRERLWGLLIAHQCFAPRQWHTEDIELLQQLATQLGIAIQQAELYQKNAQQAALIDIASDGIFVRDLSNRIKFWSKGAERIYGWKAEEVLNRVAHELFYRESPSLLKTALRTTIERGNWQGELKQLTKEEREIVVASRWTSIPDTKNPQAILVVNTDITEKKQLERQLLHAQRLESIGNLAASIAHDLNNILTPIIGFTQILPIMIPNLKESIIDIMKMIEDNAKRGSEIVNQVLLFSRGIESEWQTVNIEKILTEVLRLIRETFPKSIAIESYISSSLWKLEGDPTQLHQVLMNLCVNARDAMPNGGELIISAENLRLDKQYALTNSQIDLGNYILITVTDTGKGIDPEIIDRIFEPFFTTKEPGRGTGLGLSTVMSIIKNHGGTIEVKSDRRSGTQFQIYLPASEASATENATDENLPYGAGETILVVDDEAPIREVTRATLETFNYQVITASDGLEAIAVYAQQPQEIKVVLMDLNMPEMDGLTAMRGLKKINPQVKLIATSGLATKEKVSAAESIGIKSFLTKPYTAEKLLLNLNTAILSD